MPHPSRGSDRCDNRFRFLVCDNPPWWLAVVVGPSSMVAGCRAVDIDVCSRLARLLFTEIVNIYFSFSTLATI